jgi:hypothetical protein
MTVPPLYHLYKAMALSRLQGVTVVVHHILLEWHLHSIQLGRCCGMHVSWHSSLKTNLLWDSKPVMLEQTDRETGTVDFPQSNDSAPPFCITYY